MAALPCLLSTLLLLQGVTAQEASPGPARYAFEYHRGPGAERCPDAKTLTDAVAARVGRQPFHSSAAPRIRADVSRERALWRGTVQVFDAHGQRVGVRQFESAGSDCSELTSAMVLALSLVVDPELDVLAPPAPVVMAPPAPIPAPTEPPSPPLLERYFTAVGVHGAIGAAPAATAGVSLEMGGRGPLLSLSLFGRADLPRAVNTGPGQVKASLLAAGVTPCLWRSAWGACISGSAGILRVSGEGLVEGQKHSILTSLAGVRLIRDVTLNSVFSLRLSLGAQFFLTRVTVTTDGSNEIWTTPPVEAHGGAALVTHFN